MTLIGFSLLYIHSGMCGLQFDPFILSYSMLNSIMQYPCKQQRTTFWIYFSCSPLFGEHVLFHFVGLLLDPKVIHESVLLYNLMSVFLCGITWPIVIYSFSKLRMSCELFNASQYLFKHALVLAFSIKNGVDPMGRSAEKPRTVEDVIDRAKPWQLSEILDPVQCRSVTMPESTDSSSKVC